MVTFGSGKVSTVLNKAYLGCNRRVETAIRNVVHVINKSSLGYNPRVLQILSRHFVDGARILASHPNIITAFTGKVDPGRLLEITGNIDPFINTATAAAKRDLEKAGLIREKLFSKISNTAKDVLNSLSLTSFGRVAFNQSSISQPIVGNPKAKEDIPSVLYFRGNAERNPIKKESPLERLKKNWKRWALLKRFELLRRLGSEELVELSKAMDPQDLPEFFKTVELLIYLQLFKRSRDSDLAELCIRILKVRPEFPRILNLKELAEFYDNLDPKGRSKLRNAIAPGRVRLFKARGIKFFEEFSPKGQVRLFKSLSPEDRAKLLNVAGEKLLSKLKVELYNKEIIVDVLFKPIKPSKEDRQKIIDTVNRIKNSKIKKEIGKLVEEHWGIELS